MVVQARYFEWTQAEKDLNVIAFAPHAYMPMLQTAENVATTYGITRDAQDAYALSSQQLTARAQREGRFDAEIVPISATRAVVDKNTKEVRYEAITLARDAGNRPETTLHSLAGCPRSSKAAR